MLLEHMLDASDNVFGLALRQRGRLSTAIEHRSIVGKFGDASQLFSVRRFDLGSSLLDWDSRVGFFADGCTDGIKTAWT